MKTLINLTFCLLLISACDQINAAFFSSEENEDPSLIKTYYDNGTLKSEIQVDTTNNRHGLSKNYYPDGTLKTEIAYNHGTKEKAIQYYENGNKYLEFNYKNGRKEGKRTKYWENGKVQSYLEYKKDYPRAGLVEFNKSGKQRKNYPNLIVRQYDNLKTNGEYIVEVYFDKQPARGTYYYGQLIDGFMHVENVEIEKKNGKGRIVYRPMPGTFKMEKLKLVGKYITLYANPYITETSINLAIDF
ncbi:toxin-antitoxin system YwqK family antitoxin [Ekhidna sp. To15]|uniref:toxin-antitoxin system YwqK family antitoxin n=1 Tax=Ekhidna sp. To15 TaxID=3395267 RepID=UPI003F526A30